MFIQNISLTGYRNYSLNSYSFDSKGCIISGPNGIGKTNLLEAISYFAYGKSINNYPDRNILQFNAPFFKIDAQYRHLDKDFHFQVIFEKNKSIKINDSLIKKQSELYTYLQVVYFSPDDIHLIIGNPKNRRRFLDMAVAKIFPPYIEFHKKFIHILTQRNQLLKGDIDKKMKRVWDEQYLSICQEILQNRLLFLNEFNEIFMQAYQEISADKEKVNLQYSFKNSIPYQYQDDYYNECLKKAEDREIRYQTTLFGPHTEDLKIYIDQKEAVNFASQGQKRSLVIALKLALAKLIYKKTAVYPILMFDDTLAELDLRRSENILHHLSNDHQIFIATPNKGHYSTLNLPFLELSC